MRGRCASRFARKSSAMWCRSIVTRIIPIITIQIMAKTRSSSAPMSTTLNRYRQTAFATLSSSMAMRSAPSSGRVANAAIRAIRSTIAGATGTWENSFSELGQNAGFFKKHGLVLEIFYTQGAGETQQAVISGSADIGTGVGTFNTFGAFAKGAPIRVIAATHTGAKDLTWYVKADSPIKDKKDLAGKSVAYSTTGSSTYGAVQADRKSVV